MLRKDILWNVIFTVVLTGCITVCGVNAGAEAAESVGKSSGGGNMTAKTTIPEGYHLVWEDDFDGDTLDENSWNYEYHQPGWVNNELQEYVKSSENAYVKDGELIIQPIKILDEKGGASYTSGRVNTHNKHGFQYGWFEARIKVPKGQGFLPAFWMMPEDEDFYGQWPKCGEIDIMEVLGNQTDCQYGTLHYGEPHTQQQGTYTLEDGDLAEEYHVYACEWEPGEIKFYLDNELYFSVNDWFTRKEGFDEEPYPAPFNQPFYIILNVAVGGNWPGNPDESTTFDDAAAMKVDYVRVYQKESYDENVKKPEKVLELKEADATGNYITNGDFSEAEELSDEENWVFLLAGDGAANAEIADRELRIVTEDAGELDYSVQLVQAGLPMIQGERYRISFDAYADEERTVIVTVSAPDVGWIRYFEDTKVPLTKEKQTFEYVFEMTGEDDDNGRLEFNLGNQNSAAAVYLSNVRIEKTAD